MKNDQNSTDEPIPDSGDAGLDEEVLRQVGDALLEDDEVGLVLVSDLAHLKEAAAGADVGVAPKIHPRPNLLKG